jgi:hypothetical protein
MFEIKIKNNVKVRKKFRNISKASSFILIIKSKTKVNCRQKLRMPGLALFYSRLIADVGSSHEFRLGVDNWKLIINTFKIKIYRKGRTASYLKP